MKVGSRKILKIKEKAAVGIEPTNKGFADLCLGEQYRYTTGPYWNPVT